MRILKRVVYRLPIAYYYSTPGDKARMQAFKAVSGDSETVLVMQFVRGWIGRNREYYWDLAKLDARTRKLDMTEWGRIVLDGGMDALPAYQESLPNIPPDPLQHVTLPPTVERRPMTHIKLGNQNAALVKVGAFYANDAVVQFISRIVYEHLQRNWERLYKQQIEMDNLQNWGKPA